MNARRPSRLFRLITLLVLSAWLLVGWPWLPFPLKVREAQAAIPAFVACGAEAAGTGNVTPALPTGWAENHILLLFVESANQPGSAPTGYTQVTDSPQGTGTAGGTAATALEVHWKRAGASESAPTVTDRGDHTIATICAFSGVITTGDPWDVTSGGVESTSDNSLSATGDTTTVTDALVVIATANGIDGNTTTRYSSWANSNLTSVTERYDDGAASGNGGGLGIATGEKASAGAYGATTATLSANFAKGFMTIALKPPVGALTVDIVDSGGASVASPSMVMSTLNLAFTVQTSTGTFGVSSQKIRVTNTTATATWTLSIAASATTAVWDSVGTDYDFNDPTAGAGDGGDTDTVGGQMTVDPSGGTITPQSGCNTTGLTLGSSTAFNEGVTNSITLITAGASAGTNCYWDLTGIGISQTVPKEQPVASDYDVNMTVSVVAS